MAPHQWWLPKPAPQHLDGATSLAHRSWHIQWRYAPSYGFHANSVPTGFCRDFLGPSVLLAVSKPTITAPQVVKALGFSHANHPRAASQPASSPPLGTVMRSAHFLRPSRGILLFAFAGSVTGCVGNTPIDEAPAQADASAEVAATTAPEPPPVPQRSKADHASVVLITMDTTRADRIGAYGYPKALTPTVDSMAATGMLFERAYSVVPLTTPSHASMLTGLYPTRHGIHNNGDAILSDEFTTLAEALSGEGYATAAAVSAFVTTRVWNLDQGFADYFDSVKGDKKRAQRGRWAQERPADQVVDDLIGWLDTHRGDDRPFFLWAHFYDPHDPYLPPPEWKEKAEGRMYDGEIGFMDAQIARLQEAVNANTGAAGTAWVLVADHGEALTREHGEHTHGMYLYDPTMRIPFIVKPPKDLDKAIVESKHTVSNVDVTPTVLGMLGFKAPEDLDGLDLSPILTGGSLDRNPVYMEAESARNRFGFAPERAVAHGPLKLMDTPNPRLFDVVEDPGETKNLVKKKPDDFTRLQKAHEAIQERRVDGTGGGVASPEVLAQLEALGYMTSDGSIGDEATAKLDAKDQSELIARLDKARVLGRQRKFRKAVEEYKKVLEEHPQIGEARMNMARAYGAMKKPKQAEEVLREAVELDPASTVLKSNLASHLMTQGNFEEAYALYENILTQVPGDDVARNGIVRMYLATGQFGKALEVSQSWKDESPDSLAWDGYRGIALANLNRVPEAFEALQMSLTDDMPRKDVHNTLGNIALMTGNLETALDHFERETGWFPDDLQTRMRVGGIYMKTERWEDASVEFSFVAKRNKRDPIARRMWAQAVFNAGDYPGAQEVLAPAVALHPDDPFILLLQANILQKLGDEAGALEVFERSKQLRQAQIEAQNAGPGGAPLPGMNEASVVEAEMAQYGIPE
ncbi:MAG: hypothetical protein CL927_11490 [Deltaproteobacteria bacterium]|nr:hypothetical protein [Deltaproteobacteria bacterium]